MDFTNRPAQQPASTKPSAAASHSPSSKNNGAWKSSPMWLRIIWITLLFSVTALAVAVVTLLYFGGPKESKYIADDQVQAVFLANGQVYFGDIKAINDQYIDLQNIYYLSVDQRVQPKEGAQQNANITLLKLGCELHGPVDQMIINREQVTFWENLKQDGQVSKKIAEWIQQNPEGQKCNVPASTEE